MKPPTGGGAKVDPALPRLKCQECRRALPAHAASELPVTERFQLLPLNTLYFRLLPLNPATFRLEPLNPPACCRREEKREKEQGMQASGVQGSIMGASRMDNSYVVLSRQIRSQGPGIPPSPPSSAAAAAHNDANHQSTRAIEGSYIVLPPPAASMYKASASEGSGTQQPPPGVNSSSSPAGNGPGLHSSVTVLKRAFEIVTSQTQVEQPLCLECMRVLSDKMDTEIEDVNADIKAYEACLQPLEEEPYNILSETDFQKEKQKVTCLRISAQPVERPSGTPEVLSSSPSGDELRTLGQKNSLAVPHPPSERDPVRHPPAGAVAELDRDRTVGDGRPGFGGFLDRDQWLRDFFAISGLCARLRRLQAEYREGGLSLPGRVFF